MSKGKKMEAFWTSVANLRRLEMKDGWTQTPALDRVALLKELLEEAQSKGLEPDMEPGLPGEQGEELK